MGGLLPALGLKTGMSFVSNLFSEKPDHPMASIEEAKKLLSKLPKGNALKALEEVTSWLDTLKDASGFRPELRKDIILLVDETGQPFHAELMRLYLGEPHLQDFKGMHLWQAMHGFMKMLAKAYEVCLHDYQHAEKKPAGLKEQLPVICVRLMRAVSHQMVIELMHYIDIEQSVWDRLFGCYNFAVASQIADSMVFAYPKQALHLSPQRELLRALVMYESSPSTMAQDQIEVCFRVITRMANAFDFKTTPDADCPYYVDLSSPSPPRHVTSGMQMTDTMRFFGTANAVPKVTEIIEQHERGMVQQEQRFGSEFTVAGKLTVLRHVQMYWSKAQPFRHQERRGIHTMIEVVHSYGTISKLVARMDIDNAVNLSGEEADMLKKRSNINLAAAEENIDFTTEKWAVADASLSGIGVTIPKNSGNWVKIGDLCGLKAEKTTVWWVGAIRRLHTDPNGTVHAGIEIMAKKPLSVWLRTLGKGTEKVSAWESSSGSFAYDYLSVILLPDASNSYANATLLMEPGGFVAETIYEVMLGEKSRNIKLAKLLDEGEDYEQVKFQWL